MHSTEGIRPIGKIIPVFVQVINKVNEAAD